MGCGGAIADGDGGFDADAEDNSNVRCDPSTPFETPIAISELNIGSANVDMRLSQDELTAVFGSGDGVAYANAAFISTRMQRQQAFAAPINVDVQTSFTGPVVLTNDLLTLYYYGCEGIEQDNTICQLTRVDANTNFALDAGTTPSASSLPKSSRPEVATFLSGDGLYSLYTTVMDLEAGLYLVIAESTRADMDGAFTTSSTVVESADNVDYGTTNSNRLVIYFSEQDSTGTYHIWTGSRSSTQGAFGNLMPVHELDSAGGEYPTWLSDDMCRLYFTRNSGAQSLLYVASR